MDRRAERTSVNYFGHGDHQRVVALQEIGNGEPMLLLGQKHNLVGIFNVGGERLFSEDMFACLQSTRSEWSM